jgi:hypothetical protein
VSTNQIVSLADRVEQTGHNFVSHLHVMASAGGLQESASRWIHRLEYDKRELMLAWRYAVGAFLSRAHKKACSTPPSRVRHFWPS